MLQSFKVVERAFIRIKLPVAAATDDKIFTLECFNVKKFIHPMCDICDLKFTKRIDYDEHRLTAKHLVSVEASGKEDSFDLEYYQSLDVSAILGLKQDESKHQMDPKITKEPMGDIYDAERMKEASLLTLDKVTTYEAPAYDEKEMIGKLTFDSVVFRFYFV